MLLQSGLFLKAIVHRAAEEFWGIYTQIPVCGLLHQNVLRFESAGLIPKETLRMTVLPVGEPVRRRFLL